MKLITTSILFFLLNYVIGQVELKADGPGETYELITSVLAPGYDPIEVPDCNHNAFGNHIEEIFDGLLNTNVFKFYIHVTPDNDRCINFDRQRNEIKTYDKSPDNLLGVEGEKVKYTWKFKLNDGFQSSPNFTHLHQLKSVGGDFASMPMYTLTTRKGNPDMLELRYAETTTQITLKQTPLSPLIGVWLEVTEMIKYGTDGTYEIIIKQENNEEVLFEYSTNSIINWRAEADFVRPKWGIYRSLINQQDLRDEAVLFADFSIEEIETVSLEELNQVQNKTINTYQSNNILYIKGLSQNISSVEIFGMNGTRIMKQSTNRSNELSIDVSSWAKGAYILRAKGNNGFISKLILIY